MACVRNLKLINPSHPFIITLRMADLIIWIAYYILISHMQVRYVTIIAGCGTYQNY